MEIASGVLVDTSVWIKFFRFAQSPEAIHLDGLLQARAVRTCAPIRVEVLSGAKNERERLRLRELFHAVPFLDVPSDIWENMEEARFMLARKGRQAGLIDLMIACTAMHYHTPLWTLDDDFTDIRNCVVFSRYLPET